MRFRDGTRAALAVLLIALAAPLHADPAARARMAGLAPSERLQAFALAQGLRHNIAAPGLGSALRRALTGLAFYHDGPRPAVVSRSLRVTPVLAWDANINGGYINDRFTLGGLVFAIDPASQARSGLVAGAEAGGTLRLAHGNGRYLELQAGAEALWSPRHEIGRAAAGASACLRNHVRGWTFADLCASASRSWRALSNSSAASAGTRITTLFAGGPALHELSAQLSRLHQPEGGQNALTLGWGAVWNRAASEVSVTRLSSIEGLTVPRHRASVAITWLVAGRPMAARLAWQEAGGGMLLGSAREDTTTTASLTVHTRGDTSLELVHQVNRSTHDLFSDRRTGLTIRTRLRR